MKLSEWAKYQPFDLSDGCLCDDGDFVNGMIIDPKGWRICKLCNKPWYVQLNPCEDCGELFFNPKVPPRIKLGSHKELKFSMPGHCS